MSVHGTPECWPTCACKECDEAQRKHANARRKTATMTDRERVDAFLQTIPGDGADWWYAIVRAGVEIKSRTQNTPLGDGTVDAATWGHLRNIVDAVRQLAFVLGAAERGDDPDIPF